MHSQALGALLLLVAATACAAQSDVVVSVRDGWGCAPRVFLIAARPLARAWVSGLVALRSNELKTWCGGQGVRRSVAMAPKKKEKTVKWLAVSTFAKKRWLGLLLAHARSSSSAAKPPASRPQPS